MTMVHATVEAGRRLDLPWEVEYNALVYVLAGRGSVGDDKTPVQTGNLAVLGAGDFVTAVRQAARRVVRRPSTSS